MNIQYPPGVLSPMEAFARKVYTDHQICYPLMWWAMKNDRAIFLANKVEKSK